MIIKILVFLAFNLFFLIFSSPIYAQTSSSFNPGQTATPTASPIQSTYSLPSTINPTSALYTDLLVHNLFHTFSCLAVGQSTIGQPCLSYQLSKDAQGRLQGMPVLSSVDTSGGALGATSSLIGALYTSRPVTTVDYLASISGNFGMVKEANAQVTGSGAAVLNPILRLWQVSRNISYVIMIIIFIIIGLMIMFRNKINPQTVITAQAALPGLVIGLIMITFSFFFAGLISDMAFIGTNVVGYYFSAVKGQADKPQDLVQEISTQNVTSLMGSYVGGIDRDAISKGIEAFLGNLPPSVATYVRAGIVIAGYQFGSSFGPALGAIGGMAVCGVAALPFIAIPGINIAAMGGLGAAIPVCATAGSAIGGPAGGAFVGVNAALNPAYVASQGLWFIALIVIIYSIFRLLMRLINSFLTIIFLVITAPFQFLFASLPGRQGVATGWILNLLGNVIVFPAVAAVLYFVAFLIGQSFGPFRVSQLHNQPNNVLPIVYAQDKVSVTNTANFPLFGGLDLVFINVLLAFGALVALPAIPDIIVKTVGRAGQAGQLLGQEISSGISGGQRYLGQAQGGLGAVQKDVSGLGQFSSQTQYDYDAAGVPIARRVIPGLGAKFNPPQILSSQNRQPTP